MKNNKIENLLARMNALSPVIEANAGFSLSCIFEGVDKRLADNVFYKELGLSGEDIMAMNIKSM